MNRCRILSHAWIVVLVTGALFVTVISGCSKKEEQAPRGYQISGTAYYDCAKRPYAGQMLELVHYTNTNALSDNGGIHVITDDFGRFVFNYTNSAGDGYFTDEYQVFAKAYDGRGRLLISRIPGAESVNIGDLYVANKVQLFVDIKAGAKHGSDDTLYFGISESEYYYIFPIVHASGVYAFNAPPRLYNDRHSFSHSSFFFAVGRNAYVRNFTAASDHALHTTHQVYESEYFFVTDCDMALQRADTVRVKL